MSYQPGMRLQSQAWKLSVSCRPPNLPASVRVIAACRPERSPAGAGGVHAGVGSSVRQMGGRKWQCCECGDRMYDGGLQTWVEWRYRGSVSRALFLCYVSLCSSLSMYLSLSLSDTHTHTISLFLSGRAHLGILINLDRLRALAVSKIQCRLHLRRVGFRFRVDVLPTPGKPFIHHTGWHPAQPFEP